MRLHRSGTEGLSFRVDSDACHGAARLSNDSGLSAARCAPIGDRPGPAPWALSISDDHRARMRSDAGGRPRKDAAEGREQISSSRGSAPPCLAKGRGAGERPFRRAASWAGSVGTPGLPSRWRLPSRRRRHGRGPEPGAGLACLTCGPCGVGPYRQERLRRAGLGDGGRGAAPICAAPPLVVAPHAARGAHPQSVPLGCAGCAAKAIPRPTPPRRRRCAYWPAHGLRHSPSS